MFIETSRNIEGESPIFDMDSFDVWSGLFTEENIKKVFLKHIFPKGGRGVDRISVDRFTLDLDAHAKLIHQKCISGTYKFSPYLQKLCLKGKGKSPRVISIPTIRDKIVLKILTQFLQSVFKNKLDRDLPNTIIRKLKAEIKTNTDKHLANLKYIRLDLKEFYDSIPHNELFTEIERVNCYYPFLRVLKKAILNPTLAAGYALADRKIKSNMGVPQGLSISNILAEIYVARFDQEVKEFTLAYYRFVDDIFILCEGQNVDAVWGGIDKTIAILRLKLNIKKSTSVGLAENINEKFEFLGYSFKNRSASVRDNTYKNFINSLIGYITKYKQSIQKENSQNEATTKQIFIDEMNEKITGAIDENRRFGWIAFFSEITDLYQLYEADRIIEKTLLILTWFSAEDLKKIKKIVRAYFEINYSIKSGYIHDYNNYVTLAQKKEFLIRRGHSKENTLRALEPELIEQLFLKVKAAYLLKLDRDIGKLS
ncbi:MAG: reverse transcriptase domain-containing protein [Gammaproteobacteria bacterium]|nr:reverse transcriptase domain-containing protein [Gammaproteobacteria bacterium]